MTEARLLTQVTQSVQLKRSWSQERKRKSRKSWKWLSLEVKFLSTSAGWKSFAATVGRNSGKDRLEVCNQSCTVHQQQVDSQTYQQFLCPGEFERSLILLSSVWTFSFMAFWMTQDHFHKDHKHDQLLSAAFSCFVKLCETLWRIEVDVSCMVAPSSMKTQCV